MEKDQNKIPKIIHYCWFGGKEKSKIVLKCIESWKRNLTDYEIKEWNENNFDVNSHPYTKLAYQNKKWAFVSDFVRLITLYNEGGVYMDTDMYILKNIDNLLDFDFFMGAEDDKYFNVAIFGAKKNNSFSKKLLEKYINLEHLETIPKIVTEVYKNLSEEEKENIKIFPKNYFYPFNVENIKKFNYNNAPKESYGVHLWDYSWGNPLNKFIKKIGIYKHVKIMTEKIGIKNKIKNFLKME